MCLANMTIPEVAKSSLCDVMLSIPSVILNLIQIHHVPGRWSESQKKNRGCEMKLYLLEMNKTSRKFQDSTYLFVYNSRQGVVGVEAWCSLNSSRLVNDDYAVINVQNSVFFQTKSFVEKIRLL